MTPGARITLAILSGFLLGMCLAAASSQFTWGDNTVGFSLIGAGVAIGLLVGSTVSSNIVRRDGE